MAGVTFTELSDSPQENISASQGFAATRRLLVSYEDRLALVDALLGDALGTGGLGRGNYPGMADVLVSRVRIEPFQKLPDNVAFADPLLDLNKFTSKIMLVTVDYETLSGGGEWPSSPGTPPGTYMVYRRDIGGEYLKMPTAGLKWRNAPNVPVKPDAGPTIRVSIIEHHLTWMRVRYPPWAAIQTCTGCVNTETFAGCAAETLLFEGCKAEKEFIGFEENHVPKLGWKLEYLFREKQFKGYANTGVAETALTWNHQFRDLDANAGGNVPAWDVLQDLAGNKAYRTTDDFEKLFALEEDDTEGS